MINAAMSAQRHPRPPLFVSICNSFLPCQAGFRACNPTRNSVVYQIDSTGPQQEVNRV